MEKIILFYKFVPVADAETVMLWQKSLASSLGLKGRIIISQHGINGTLGGELKSLKRYISTMNEHSIFKDIDFKWSEGGAKDFPRLSVKVRPEIVTFGVPDEIEVDKDGIVGGGKHLKPAELHKLVEERGDEVVFLDGRNAYEAEIGRFKGAMVPITKTTKDFIEELEKPEMQAIKDRPVVTYCTGGIRCEVLTRLMKKRGFSELYQIDGGIVRYSEEFKDEGLWEGKMYVFDNRMKVAFSDKSKDIAACIKCGTGTSNYQNCGYTACNKLILMCESCSEHGAYCVADCLPELDVIENTLN